MNSPGAYLGPVASCERIYFMAKSRVYCSVWTPQQHCCTKGLSSAPTSCQPRSPPQGWRGAECEAVVEEAQPSADGNGAGAAPEGLSSARPGMSQAVKADRTGPAAAALAAPARPCVTTPGSASGTCLSLQSPRGCASLHPACHAAWHPRVPIAWVWGQGALP